MDYDKTSTFEEVIVVEGMHDLSVIKEIYPNVEIMITNGSEISNETLNELKILNDNRGLILFMDPDMQGERIRRVINSAVGPTKHAYVKKEYAISKNKKKVGVEHVPKKIIKEALNHILSTSEIEKQSILLKDLYDLELIGRENSRKLRQELGEKLGIGLNNGKTFYKKLCMFGIMREDIEKALRR